MKIAIVSSGSMSGGVSTITWKLLKGLNEDGFDSQLVSLGGRNLPSILYSDLRSIRQLRKFDAVIYMGSVAWPSHLFLRRLKLQFIHGFLMQEAVMEIANGPAKSKIGNIVILGYWMIAKLLNSISYVCHSETSWSENDLRGGRIILPQFVLSDEIRYYASLRGATKPELQTKVRLLTYGSFADSPRLMTLDQMCALSNLVERNTSKDFELLVVDPRHPGLSVGKVKTIPFGSKNDFIRLLNSSAIYVERCLDEELGLAALEAAILGIPIAKLTLPQYAMRQDYTKHDFLLADSLTNLAARLADFIKNPVLDHERYSTRSVEFVTKARTWDKVKLPLVSFLRGEGWAKVSES